MLEALRPTKVVNNVKGDFVSKEGNLNLECTRFRTRIMKGSEQVRKLMERSAINSERTYRSSTSKR